MSKTLLMGAVLALPCPVLFAGNAPDIVWTGTLHTNWVYALAFSQDSSLLASGSDDGVIRLWGATNGTLTGSLTNVDGPVLGLWFRSDGALLSWHHLTGVLTEWRPVNQTPVSSWALAPGTGEYSERAGLFAGVDYASGEGTLAVWRLNDAVRVFTKVVGGGSVTFSPDASGLAIAYSVRDRYEVDLYRTSDWSLRLTFHNHDEGAAEGGSAVYSPDGSLLVVPAYPDSPSEMWRMPAGEYYGMVVDTRSRGHPKLMLFTPDGRVIVTVNHDEMRLWRVQPGNNDFPAFVYDQGFSGAVSMAVAPNGKLVALGLADGKVMVLRMPILMQNPRREGNGLRLEWLGASGPYQLQRRETLAAGDWQNLGSPSNDPSATVDLSGSQAFFRVISLP